MLDVVFIDDIHMHQHTIEIQLAYILKCNSECYQFTELNRILSCKENVGCYRSFGYRIVQHPPVF
jgi:hypothetical protein